MAVHFIGFDVHCAFTEIAVVTNSGRVTQRQRCGTTIPELVAVLEAIRRPRRLTFEEGQLADWLQRHLARYVDELVVCEPRRNHLVAKDSDKDDPIDAAKLAQLYRGGYLKAVHHPHALERAIFKQHINLYHARVRQRVREANHIMAQLRRHGVFVRESAFAEPDDRGGLLERLPNSRLLRADIELLWRGYDVVVEQVEQMRHSLICAAQREEPIRRFADVPGLRWVRAATFYAYIDTPRRFPTKAKLWRYCGIGLQRSHSGQGPRRVSVSQQSNRVLRGVLLGAAQTIIDRKDSAFYDKYQQGIQEEGMSFRNARRNVARSLAATLWGMWKNGDAYRADQTAPRRKEGAPVFSS